MVVFNMAEIVARDPEQPAALCDLDYWAELNLSTCFVYGGPGGDLPLAELVK